VDPTGLQAGVHSAKIKAYDSSCVQKGALFEVPITVVQPIVVDNPKFEFVGEEVLCKPNTIIRTFLLVPSNATYVSIFS
jgi:tripeptidyl-peptidase-2